MYMKVCSIQYQQIVIGDADIFGTDLHYRYLGQWLYIQQEQIRWQQYLLDMDPTQNARSISYGCWSEGWHVVMWIMVFDLVEYMII